MSRASADYRPPVLLADDSRLECSMLERILSKAGFEVVTTRDGFEALERLREPGAPRLLVLDWEMPGPSGPEIVRWLRARPEGDGSYVILLTARNSAEDVVAGFESGADDFITKPFRADELLARLRSGVRVLWLQDRLRNEVTRLEAAMAEVRQLRGLIPICMHCHRVRTEGEHWQQLEAYLEAHSDASFSHSLCGECLGRYYPDHAPAEATPGSARTSREES